MNILLDIKQKIAKIIKSHTGQIIDLSQITIPPDDQLGDLALPCFELAKKLKKAPNQLAADLAVEITGKKIIAKAHAAGPYLNFFLDKEALAKLVLDTINNEKNKFDENKLKAGQKIMIEYSTPNPLKDFHVGHLRNVCIGASLVNCYKKSGAKVIPANYYNDRGSHVAKVLLYWQRFVKNSEVPKDPQLLGKFLADVYVKATALTEQDENFKTEALTVAKKLEAGDKTWLKLWKMTRDLSIEIFDYIYKILGVKFETIYYQSAEEENGKKIIADLVKRQIAKVSDGATIIDLTPYNLDVLMLLRSDGTALYAVSDLSIAQKKFSKFKLDESIYLVDIRQSLYFKQLIKTFELMGFTKKIIHVPYEFVKLKEGVMSSRAGNVVTFFEVYDQCVQKVTAEILKRHDNWPQKKVAETASKMSLAALKFDLLKQSNNKIVTFDIDEALSLEGFTGPYIQYATVRINSILAKAPKIDRDFAYQHYLNENIEKSLLKKLAGYPQVVEDILADNDPSRLAHYLYNLAAEFNKFYHEMPVLKAEEKIMKARLILIRAIKQVLTSGLAVLGIDVLDEM